MKHGMKYKITKEKVIWGDNMLGRPTNCSKLFLLILLFLIVFQTSAKALNTQAIPSTTTQAVSITTAQAVNFIDTSTNLIKNSKFTIYKVMVNVNNLNIRSKASVKGIVLGTYNAGNIVDILGKSGSFLKTEKGYIAEAYTKKIIGMFAGLSRDSKVLRSSDSRIDDRLAEAGKYYEIKGSNGSNLLIRIGRINAYIPQSAVSSISSKNYNKISIGWDYMNKKSSVVNIYNNPAEYVNMKSYELGLDILSPTWFSITGNAKDPSTINVTDIGDPNYISIAHKNGYEVWARLEEMDKNRAAVEFNDETVRARIINQICNLAISYDLDGINVDYEALGSENRDGFTNFMKELNFSLNKLSLKVSIDVTKYSSQSSLYSLCYDRKSLSNYCDYLILMGYDEHVSSSKDPGSVGSYNWVDSAIKDFLSQGVPKNKLILAVPFYLREYTVIPYDAVIFDKNGKLYNVPVLSDSNKLLDGKFGNVFKCTGTDGNWYIIDYNGNKGYILKTNAQFLAANVPPSTSGSSINITTIGGINTATGGAINLLLPYDVVILQKDGSIYKSENEITDNNATDASANKYFKYSGMAGDFFIINYNGKKVYASKTQASYAKAGSRAVGSNALSMGDALNKIAQNSGSISKDEQAHQSLGIYYKDGNEHLIWLENKDSMQWRMGLINNYDLAGTAIWSLYWKPTEGIWDVIKGGLKQKPIN